MEALALVSGKVEKVLLIRNEYLVAENRTLKSKLNIEPRRRVLFLPNDTLTYKTIRYHAVWI